MSAVPADVDAGQLPPMTVPLRHFLVGNLFLLLCAVLFTTNLVWVVHEHSPQSLTTVLLGEWSRKSHTECEQPR